MRKIGGSYQFFALLNGVNVRGTMGVINGPLRQQYKKGTSNYFPDWETSANKPIIFAKLLRDDTGSVLIPTSLKMFYNDVEITFDSGTGLSTNASMAGFFKKASRAVTVGSSQYNMLTVEIVKNLIPISSFDNDTIRLQGTVEIAGQTINFDAITSVVEIIETVGQSTTIYLEGDTDITNDSPAATIRAHALKTVHHPPTFRHMS